MGEVWLAQHGLLARPVAVKLINSRYFSEIAEERDLAVERFQQEANHGYFVHPHDHRLRFCQRRWRSVYAMEVLDADLYDLVDITVRSRWPAL